jgi:hypothetical protein
VVGAGIFYLRTEAAQAIHPGRIATYAGLASPLWDSDENPNDQYLEALADALDITVSELQTAIEAVREAQIESAIEAGDLSEEQAERMRERPGGMGRPRRGPMIRDEAATELLATELGISVATLETAQEQARQLMIEQAIASGELSEEQVEMMQARQALAPYLEAARSEIFQEAIEQALSDGAISQAQADLLLEAGETGPNPRRGGFHPPFGDDEG